MAMINNTVSKNSVSGSKSLNRSTKGLVNPMAAGQQFVKPQVQTTQAVQSQPSAKSGSSSVGQYKGVNIVPGTTEQIMEQMKSIDSQNMAKETAEIKNNKGNGGIIDILPKSKGLITPPKTEKPLYQSIVEQLANRASDSSTIDKAAADLLSFQQGTSQKIADIRSQTIPLEFQQGRAQVVQQASAEKERALQQALSNALTARTQNIGALQSAASLAAPSQASFGQTVFDPITGTYKTGSGLGGVVTQGNISSLQTLVPQYQAMQANFKGIENLQGQLEDLLGTTDLNPSSIPYINQAISSILRKGVGDPNYQRLLTYLEDIASKYATYFGSTGTVTNQVREVANSLINGNASPEAISEVIAGLNTQAAGVMKGVYDQIQSILNNPGTVASPSTPEQAMSGPITWDNLL